MRLRRRRSRRKKEKRCNLRDEDYTISLIRNYFLMTLNHWNYDVFGVLEGTRTPGLSLRR